VEKPDAGSIPVRLNLGCGRKPMAQAWNVDVAAECGADATFDLNLRPWPLPKDHFKEIFAMDVIEHVESVPSVLEEIHLVASPGALIHVTVPHFSSHNAFCDPTHRHFFGMRSFDYFTKGHALDFYSKARFEVESVQLYFRPSLLNKIIWRLANRWPDVYERRWSWIFPAWFLEVKLRVLKG